MDWGQIRESYARQFAAKKRTQAQVAAAGGLKNQNLVSKVLRNTHLGPTVETFVRAVEGLGMSVSEFFAELEGREPRVTEQPAAPRKVGPAIGKAFIVQTLIEALQRGVAAPARPTRRRRRKKP
jgi:transcriptional regulator with XRE-family HTH domain